MTRNVLLIGSIPLASANQVFEIVNSMLDGLVKRLPDGECGERQDWVKWQSTAFSRIPFVEPVTPANEMNAGHHHLPQFRVRPGFPTEAVRFGPLGYAKAAIESHDVFASMKAAGKLPVDSRFQIGMPTALSVVGQHMDPAFQAAVEPAYEKRLRVEVEEIVSTLPRQDLAIQWNLATELSMLAGHRPVYFDKVADGILERLVRLCESVPEDVELGLHFCFHDFTINGFPLPKDLDQLVDLANGVLASTARSIDWLHMPVPHTITDKSYFQPLQRLMAPAETNLYLGLLHTVDGLPGAKRRIELASQVVTDFGIGAECGLAEISVPDITSVLELHREAAKLH